MGIFDFLTGGGSSGPSTTDLMWQQYYADKKAKEDAFYAQQQQQGQLDYLNQLRAEQAAKEAEAKARDPTATRTGAMNVVNAAFAPEFERNYIPDTLLDTLKNQIYTEQRGQADELINRMLKRGVLTPTGQQAAEAELERQAPSVREQLNTLGQTLLEGERGKLSDISGRAKERASSLGVGEPFDVAPYSTALSSEVGRFTGDLSDLFRSNVSGNLFDTSTLGNIGGAAQGAGNQPFDPSVTQARPGSIPEDPFANIQKPAQKRTATVF